MDPAPQLSVETIGFCCHRLEKRVSARFTMGAVSFELTRGKVLVLMGPSGAGKSTLLRCLNLLTPFDGGLLQFDDGARAQAGDGRVELSIPPSQWRQRVGMVFQELALWPNKTVMDNIMEGPRTVLGLDFDAAQSLARELLHIVGIQDLGGAFPNELSGGERQRVALARCLAMRPRLILLDEVTSALDPENVAGLLDLIATLKDADRSLVIATHHVAFAREVGDELLFMDRGVVLSRGALPETIDRPSNPRFASFLNALDRTR